MLFFAYLGDIAFCNSLAGYVKVLKSISFMINVKYHNTSAVLEHYHEVFKVSCLVISLFHLQKISEVPHDFLPSPSPIPPVHSTPKTGKETDHYYYV